MAAYFPGEKQASLPARIAQHDAILNNAPLTVLVSLIGRGLKLAALLLGDQIERGK